MTVAAMTEIKSNVHGKFADVQCMPDTGIYDTPKLIYLVPSLHTTHQCIKSFVYYSYAGTLYTAHEAVRTFKLGLVLASYMN